MTLNRSLLGRGLAAGIIVAGGALLQAHMVLSKSEPAANAVLAAPPAHVMLSFGEAPDMKVTKLDLKGPSDKTKLVNVHVMAKNLMADVQGDAPDGAYTIQWQSAGDDGHMQKGEIAFTIKRK